jgi:diguanylate cyclase (GGDEF)-like protein
MARLFHESRAMDARTAVLEKLADRPHALRDRMSARSRFAVAGIALALALSVAAPVVARVTGIGIEACIFALAAIFAVGIGYRCGERFDALEQRSLEDPVTRVGNRRHWDERADIEVERAIGSRMPLSLLILDVDNLKKLNDAHGHGCGDRALRIVGQVLLSTCRSRDVAARFGGDEFAVLLPRTRVTEALIVAERIRNELARKRCEIGAPFDAALTVSIGVADLDSAASRSSAALFEAADFALYRAKRTGRDRVHVLEAPLSSGVIRLDEVRAARRKGPAIS